MAKKIFKRDYLVKFHKRIGGDIILNQNDMLKMSDSIYSAICEQYGLVETSKIEEIYNALKNCKEGSCYYCSRYNTSCSNNYECKKQLLNDCFDVFDEIINDLYEYRKFQEKLIDGQTLK